MEYSKTIQTNGPYSLKSTLESGQTFLWNRFDGNYFDDKKGNTYYTVHKKGDRNIILIIEQKSEKEIYIRSNYESSKKIVKKRLGLNHNINEIKQDILSQVSDNNVIVDSINENMGLRVVNEPLFSTLISFICSTRMHLKRIHQIISDIKEKFGKKIRYNSREFYTFPNPNKLAKVSEQKLREVKTGYRAPYIKESSEKYLNSEIDLPKDNEIARSNLKDFKGVGTKVADCTLLYGDGRTDVVPVDTWISKAVKTHIPEIYEESNEAVARNFENYFGEYAGYAQAYLFHYIR